MGLAATIEKFWYGPSPGPLFLLLPLEGLFRGASALRRRCAQPQDCGAPVVVVGNLAVGGSGKTPLVLALAQFFCQRGYRVGIVSRGYGGRAAQYPLDVFPDSEADLVGDEPLLLARRSGVPVTVAPDRPAAARRLVRERGCNLIISDDGLQHYRLARTVEIVVIDGQRRMGNGHCLPVGPLREGRGRLCEVEFRVVNGAAAEPGEVAMGLQPGAAQRLDDGAQLPLEDWLPARRRVHGVAAIGHPPRFFAMLRKLGFEVVAHPFADHHGFCREDFAFAEQLPILMTEKDAVKCQGLQLDDAWYVPVEAELDPSFYARLEAQLVTRLESLSQKR